MTRLIASVLAIAGVILLVCWGVIYGLDSGPSKNPLEVTEEVRNAAEEIKEQRRELDRTVWSEEVLAQEYEQLFVKLWDDLRQSKTPHQVLADFPFQSLSFGELRPVKELDWEIGVRDLGGYTKQWSSSDWKAFLKSMTDLGYQLEQSEWHHSQFRQLENKSCESKVSIKLHVKTLCRKLEAKNRTHAAMIGKEHGLA